MRGNKLNKFLDELFGTPFILLLAALQKLSPSSKPQPPTPQRILAVKLAALGDTLLLIPALRSLKERFPQSQITLLATSVNADLAGLFPQYIDGVHRLEIGRIVKNPFQFFRFVRRLREKKFEMALDFEQWALVTPIVLNLARIPFSIGFKSKSKVRHLLYSKAVPRKGASHEAGNFLDLVKAAGAENQRLQLELPVKDVFVRAARDYLTENGWKEKQPLILIHPGCGSHGFPREWPIESYKELCSRLASSTSPFFVFTGVGREKILADALAAHVGARGCVWEKHHLEELIALLSLADLAVTGNNGVMHVLAALGRPQIALHGPTDAKKWGPLNDRAVVIQSSCPGCPCLDFGYEYHRTDGYCMAQISVEQVFAAASKMFQATQHARETTS